MTSLPRAKYMDSVIILKNETLVEELMSKVVAEKVDGVYYWFYYINGVDGYNSRLMDEDILMNLTTQKNYMNEEPKTIPFTDIT